jgi:RND family efflux transporter MFP subunit
MVRPAVSELSRDLASLKIDREPKAKGGGGIPSWVIWVVLAGGVVALGWFVGYPRLQDALYTKTVETGTVQMVSPAQGQVQLTATGYVVAQVYAKVAAKVPGRVAEIMVEEGDSIAQGQPVARLEDVDQKSALQAARARTAAARARVATARAAVAQTKLQLQREEQLVASGVSPKATAEDLRAKMDSEQAAVRAAEAEAAAADADAKSIQIQLDSFLIVSPIKGVVVDRLVEVGEGVSPGFGTPGVLEVVDMDSLVVEIDVPESRLAQVIDKAPCEIILDAYPSQRYRGEVKEIGRRINRAKATVPIKVAFIDRPKEVLPDMAARVSFLSKAIDEKTIKQPPRLMVPTSAVVSRSGGEVVFVYDDGKLRMTSVKAGPAEGDLRPLDTPLAEGTKVVLSPADGLSDGEKVKEKN